MSGLLISAIATFTLCFSLIVVLRRLTPLLKLVDRPDAIRKEHKSAIPLCGGVSIFAAFSIFCFADRQPDVLGINFWLGLLVILLMGVVDDRRPLPASLRFAMQIAMAVSLVGGASIGSLSVGMLFSGNPTLFLPVYFVVGVLFVAGLVNAWNMIDGVDGLAGGAALVALVWLMFVANFAGMTRLIMPLQILAVCLCAFLFFNMRSPWRSRASIFMGDAGSTALGATIAYIILLLATESVAVPFPALLWLVILPVTDTLSLIVRRLAAGRNPMSADRWHLHHLLLDFGLSTAATTNTLLVISAICGGIGYLGISTGMPGEVMAIGLVVPVALHTAFVLAATGHMSKLRAYSGDFESRSKASLSLERSADTAFMSLAPAPVVKDE